MIAVGRISAAFHSSTRELVSASDDASWLDSDSTLVSVCVTTRGGFASRLLPSLLDRCFVVVGPSQSDEDGVVFQLRSLVLSFESPDDHTATFMIESNHVVSIEPDNLVGGRLLVVRAGLDDDEQDAASRMTAYLPTAALARHSAAAKDDADDFTSKLMRSIVYAASESDDAEFDVGEESTAWQSV